MSSRAAQSLDLVDLRTPSSFVASMTFPLTLSLPWKNEKENRYVRGLRLDESSQSDETDLHEHLGAEMRDNGKASASGQQARSGQMLI